MATPKSSQSKAARVAKKAHRKPRRNWNRYVSKSLKSINKSLTMSSKTAAIINSFVDDMFQKIASEAANIVRANKRRTLGSREIQTAVRLVLPAELAKHAMAEATRAIANASA